MDISFTVCVCACVCMCTVTDFSAKNNAGGVKFFAVVHRRLGRGISYFGELCSPRSPKWDESASHREVTANVSIEMRRWWNMARRVDVGRHVWL